MTTLESARRYLELGWSVIPVKPGTKQPLIEWKQYQERRPTPEDISHWFREDTPNIGLVCGAVSGVVVVDSDLYKGKSGLAIESPLRVATPRGGFHDYFQYTPDIGNSVSAESATDIRSDGGMVVLPPSVHPNGKRYTWLTEPSEELLAHLPHVPHRLLVTLQSRRATRSPFNLAESIGVAEGQRNDSLYRALCSTLSRLPDVDRDKTGWHLALALNSTFHPPLSEREVQTTFRNALGFVRDHPPHRRIQVQGSETFRPSAPGPVIEYGKPIDRQALPGIDGPPERKPDSENAQGSLTRGDAREIVREEVAQLREELGGVKHDMERIHEFLNTVMKDLEGMREENTIFHSLHERVLDMEDKVEKLNALHSQGEPPNP
jgi:hypothetical protein